MSRISSSGEWCTVYWIIFCCWLFRMGAPPRGTNGASTVTGYSAGVSAHACCVSRTEIFNFFKLKLYFKCNILLYEMIKIYAIAHEKFGWQILPLVRCIFINSVVFTYFTDANSQNREVTEEKANFRPQMLPNMSPPPFFERKVIM
jgi:hypothetical protein